MKLPPTALTAPSLCPRCDAPAIMTDFCIQCSLQLRRCGACLGVAGPFDRYCGFCGHELLLGERRSPVWRLWILAALVPLAAGIAFGISPLAGSAAGALNTVVSHAPAGAGQAPVAGSRRSANLALAYAVPSGWQASDGSKAPGAAAIPWVLLARDQADLATAAGARGDVFAYRPQDSVIEVGRPSLTTGPASAADPASVIAVQVVALTSAPPPQTAVSIERDLKSLSVGGRPAGEVVLKLTRGSDSVYLDRTYIYAPTAGGVGALVVVDAIVPSSEWPAADSPVQAVISSLRFS